MTARQRPVTGDHTRTVWSPPAEASSRPDAIGATPFTQDRCPRRTRTQVCFSRSQIRTVRSRLVETRTVRPPTGSTQSPFTQSS